MKRKSKKMVDDEIATLVKALSNYDAWGLEFRSKCQLTHIPVKRKSMCSKSLPRHFEYKVMYHRPQDDINYSQHFSILCSGSLLFLSDFLFFIFQRLPSILQVGAYVRQNGICLAISLPCSNAEKMKRKMSIYSCFSL
jgi:hypothetical protein